MSIERQGLRPVERDPNAGMKWYRVMLIAERCCITPLAWWLSRRFFAARYEA